MMGLRVDDVRTGSPGVNGVGKCERRIFSETGAAGGTDNGDVFVKSFVYRYLRYSYLFLM